MRGSRSVSPLHKLLMKKNPQNPNAYCSSCRGSRAGCNSLILAGDTPAATSCRSISLLFHATVIAAWLAIFCASGFAQTPDNVAEREVHRRQVAIPQGE